MKMPPFLLRIMYIHYVTRFSPLKKLTHIEQQVLIAIYSDLWKWISERHCGCFKIRDCFFHELIMEQMAPKKLWRPLGWKLSIFNCLCPPCAPGPALFLCSCPDSSPRECRGAAGPPRGCRHPQHRGWAGGALNRPWGRRGGAGQCLCPAGREPAAHSPTALWQELWQRRDTLSDHRLRHLLPARLPGDGLPQVFEQTFSTRSNHPAQPCLPRRLSLTMRGIIRMYSVSDSQEVNSWEYFSCILARSLGE